MSTLVSCRMSHIIFERVRSRRELYDPSALERYIRSAVLPRFMQRLREIEDGVVSQRDQLERARYRESCDGDPELFAIRWREVAKSWRFDDLNELIAEHNEYYPIERNLPIDPRTGDYVTIVGRSYRRGRSGATGSWSASRLRSADAPGRRSAGSAAPTLPGRENRRSGWLEDRACDPFRQRGPGRPWPDPPPTSQTLRCSGVRAATKVVRVSGELVATGPCGGRRTGERREAVAQVGAHLRLAGR